MKMRAIQYGLCLFASLSFFANAMQPPTKQQIEKYRLNGQLEQRITDAQKFGNFKISPHLLIESNQRLKNQINGVTSDSSQSTTRLPWHRGLPAEGTVKTFTLLLDFSDAPAPDHQTKEVITNHIYGEGFAERYPNESLTKFYQRSSYNKLNITGDVIGWYRISKPRSSYTESSDANEMIKEALRYYADQGHDFSQYDNDNDGYIDYFSVVWTGEIGEWATLWWGWQSSMYDPDFLLSNKQLSAFSWQWLSSNNATDDFDPLTLIHETGHGLGLPDFYDYDPDIGPDGGTGGMDMMDGTWGDHGAFSKFVLGWITPQVVGAGQKQVTLQPSSSSEDALIIMPELTIDKPFSEYFVVQNRDQLLNDKPLPTSGVLIWHVDAEINDFGFVKDNSFTDTKLIRLMEADGLEQIEKNLGADSGDYYQPGKEFTTTSIPNSQGYLNGSGVEIKQITKSGKNVSFSAGIADIPSINLTGIEPFSVLNSEQTLTAQIASNSVVTSVSFYINDQLMVEDSSAPYEFLIKSNQLGFGELKISASVLTQNNLKNATTMRVVNLPASEVHLVVSLNQGNSAREIAENLVKNGKTVFSVNDFPIINPAQVPVVFVDNSAADDALSEVQAQRINDYINAGGHLFYENFDFYWANGSGFEQFTNNVKISRTGQWSQDAAKLVGAENSVVFGLEYEPEYTNDYILYIGLASTASDAQSIWQVDGLGWDVAVASSIGAGKIIASSARFSEIPASLQQVVMSNYLDYFTGDANTLNAKVRFDSPEIAHNEQDATLSVILKRNFDDGTNSEVLLALESISATEGVDFQPLTQSRVTFAAGSLEQVVAITINDNQQADGDRHFNIVMSGENTSSQNRVKVTLVDNENRGVVRFEKSNLTVAENSGTFDIVVQRLNGSDDELLFLIESLNGTAVAGTDFESLSQVVKFSAGEVTKIITVSIKDNTVVDSDRKFKLELFSDYLMGENQLLEITISNDDVAPPVVVPPTNEKGSSGGSLWLMLLVLLGFNLVRKQN
ncbi:M6 family metalloprotease domain-containing protein [Pseudoalteromonas tunicata]|uniref:M6 family metalloprotease domain-containing protein n=1 Tax=Pseudoalteromonas tunicata TaxID=314281 RepID=UPI00273F8C37|nr:M6 family metalloprotease domain-containing protein [Pseudoalteromonas tunicata]MDP5213839.1 M6 family metalloprotease domain-containing protein [Pseudoalteromonas tunicata]